MRSWRQIFVCAVLLSGLLVGGGTVSPAAQGPHLLPQAGSLPGKGWKTYRNTLYDFSFRYPRNFVPLPMPTDHDGATFYLNTADASYSTRGTGFIGVPHHAIVISGVGVFNAADLTCAKAERRPKTGAITRYRVRRYRNGYEIDEVERKSTCMVYVTMFFDQRLVNTLTVVVPNHSSYRKLALRVLKSFDPLL
ncbi:MAG: hypothetical protein OWU84_00545 [Firmicutes bacterium]|nr:hypothetical protein [Bacillota bacterium]